MKRFENSPSLIRQAEVRKVNDDRTVEVSFSSEAEILRWFGIEVLGHRGDEINLQRFEGGAAVLVNHNTDDIVGVIEKVWTKGNTGRALIRFGSSMRAQEIFADVQDGIWRHISVGYFVHEMILHEEREDGNNVYRVTDWEPYEISLVTVPADTTVGVGREQDKSQIMEMIRMLNVQEQTTRSMRIKSGKENKAVIQERKRVADLITVGEQYDAESLSRQCISSGASLHDLNQMILERGGLKPTKMEDPEIGMTADEIGNYSICRAIMAKVDPDNHRQAAGFELECSNAVRQSKERQGIKNRGNLHIPHDVLSVPATKRGVTIGSAPAGGDLVGTEHLAESFTELLRNTIALQVAGATYLPGLVGNVVIPRQTGTANTFWLAENGTPTESSATFDQIALSPKTVGAYSEISRLALLQAAPEIESLISQDLANALAQAIDLAGINGSGVSNQPTGILNTVGVGVTALGTNGAAPNWDAFVDMESAVAAANAEGATPAYLTNTKVRGKAKKVFIDAGSGQRIWDNRIPDKPINGYRAVISNQVPSNLVKGSSGAVCSAAIFGNWADLIIGMWGGLDLLINPYSLDTSGQVRITSFQDVDIVLRHPESFNIINDALTT